MKLNTDLTNPEPLSTNFGTFKIKQLFDIRPVKWPKENNKYIPNNKLLDENGQNVVVACSAVNNGIVGHTKYNNTEQGNIITFSDTTNAEAIFYQPDPFVGSPHVQGMYPKFSNATQYILQYIATAFKSVAIQHNFDYGNKFRRDIAENIDIQLPVTSSGEPDWQYMEDYMKDIMEGVEHVLDEVEYRPHKPGTT